MKPVIRVSSLDRLLSCPGSRTLIDRLNNSLLDFTEGGDAMTWRGNWCHWASARRLVAEHGATAPDGLAAPALPMDWKPAPWDEAAVDWYVGNVVVGTPDDHAILVEHRIIEEFPRFTLSGQLDCYTLSPNREEFTIDDLKSGVNEVDHAEVNWQLAGYAFLLKTRFPALKRGKLRIFQRASSVPISEVEVDDLDQLVSAMEARINVALDAYLNLETGYKQCRLCPCVEFCPALSAEIEAMKLLLTIEQVELIKVTQDLKSLGDLAQRCRAIAGPGDRIIDEFKARLEAQGRVELTDGTVAELVTVNGRRTVTAPQTAYEFAKNQLGEDAAWRTLSMSLSSLEDELVESGLKRTSKKEASASSWINDNLSHLVVRPQLKQLKFK